MTKMKNPLFSWIVPAYNVENYIDFCLKSLMNVGLPCDSYEIIIVNDGSTDRTQIMIENFALNHSNVKIIKQKNGGLSVARNVGIKNANGKYIHFIDSDDIIINPSLFLKCIEIITETELDILTFKHKIIYDSYESQGVREYDSNFVCSNVMSGQDMWKRYSFIDTATTYLINRQFLIDNDIWFKPGQIMEDFGFNLNVFMLARNCIHTNACIYGYRYNNGSLMHNTSIEAQRKLFKHYIANAEYAREFLHNNAGELTEESKQVIADRSNYQIILCLMRAFKVDNISSVIRVLRQKSLYPFDWCKREEYQNSKIKLFYNISQCKILIVFLSKMYKCYLRLNPKALHFRNW